MSYQEYASLCSFEISFQKMQRALITSTSTHYLQVQQNLQIEKCHDFIFFLHSYIPYSEKGKHLFSFEIFKHVIYHYATLYYIFSLYLTHWKSLKYFLHSTIAYKLRTYLIQCTCSLLEKKRECHSNYIISFKKIVMLSWNIKYLYRPTMLFNYYVTY